MRKGELVIANPERISPKETYEKLKGRDFLVCAYDDNDKCRQLYPKGVISFTEFKSKLPSLSKDQEIIFYCTWPQEATCGGQAAKYQEMGCTIVKVLGGGVEEWKAAGYSLT